MNHSRRDSVGDGHVVTGAAIPSIRQQIEQLSTLASKASAESSSRRGVISDETRRLISESSSERGRRLQLETREQYMATLRRLGQATSRQLADALGVSQAAVKTRMLELLRMGLVRDLGGIKKRIYEAV